MKEILNRNFRIWSYTVSHSFLILRSPMKYADVEGYDEGNSYNIDIEFTAVNYLEIPCSLKGFKINIIKDEIPVRLMEHIKNTDLDVYEIISNNSKYYIVAGSYLVGSNRWLTEDRTSNMEWEYDEILGSSETIN